MEPNRRLSNTKCVFIIFGLTQQKRLGSFVTKNLCLDFAHHPPPWNGDSHILWFQFSLVAGLRRLFMSLRGRLFSWACTVDLPSQSLRARAFVEWASSIPNSGIGACFRNSDFVQLNSAFDPPFLLRNSKELRRFHTLFSREIARRGCQRDRCHIW